MHNNVKQKSGQMTIIYAEGFWKTVLTLHYENLAVILNSFFKQETTDHYARKAASR